MTLLLLILKTPLVLWREFVALLPDCRCDGPVVKIRQGDYARVWWG